MWLHPLGFFSEYCNPMEKGLEQGQDCAAFFISASSESSSADPTGDIQKPSALSRQLFSQMRGAAQMNKVPCWILVCQFCLTWAEQGVPKLGLSAKTCVKCEIYLCNYYCTCHSCLPTNTRQQDLSPEYYQSQNMQAKRARIHNLGNNCIFCPQAVFYRVLKKKQARH